MVANRASGRFYKCLHKAAFLWLPEIGNPTLLAALLLGRSFVRQAHGGSRRCPRVRGP